MAVIRSVKAALRLQAGVNEEISIDTYLAPFCDWASSISGILSLRYSGREIGAGLESSHTYFRISAILVIAHDTPEATLIELSRLGYRLL